MKRRRASGRNNKRLSASAAAKMKCYALFVCFAAAGCAAGFGLQQRLLHSCCSSTAAGLQGCFSAHSDSQKQSAAQPALACSGAHSSCLSEAASPEQLPSAHSSGFFKAAVSPKLPSLSVTATPRSSRRASSRSCPASRSWPAAGRRRRMLPAGRCQASAVGLGVGREWVGGC